jgi:hypothetical protein
MHKYLLKASYKDGHREGKAAGLGIAIAAVRSLCAVLGIDLTEARTEQLSRLTDEQLRRLVEAIESKRCWPEPLE